MGRFQRNGGGRGGQAKNKPVQSFRAWSPGSGSIEVAVWSQENDGRTSYSCTFNRSYKQGDEWKDSQSLFPPDLLVLQRLMGQAWDWISEQE